MENFLNENLENYFCFGRSIKKMVVLKIFLIIAFLIFFVSIFSQVIILGINVRKIPLKYSCSGISTINNINSMVTGTFVLTAVIMFLIFLIIGLAWSQEDAIDDYGFKNSEKYRLPIILFLVLVGIFTIINIGIQSIIFYVLRTGSCGSANFQDYLLRDIKIAVSFSIIEFLVVIFLFTLFIFVQK